MKEEEWDEIILSLVENRVPYLDLSNKDFTSIPSPMERLAEVLCTNTSLQHLNLRRNSLDDKDIKLLAAALKMNCSLKVLDLRINDIGDQGAIALADVLTVNSVLLELYLSFTLIG